MSTEAFDRAAELFERLLPLDPGERERILLEHEGESALVLDQVRRMLAGEEQPEPGLDGPILGRAVEARLPERIGAFRILGVLGEGGMGRVFEAEQESPRRRVALKVLRGAFVSSDVMRRFEHEAQVLGWLNHPGIATVFESGSADLEGARLPYLAMELVRGARLDVFVERQRPSVSERVELVARIADAVHHAHLKGVVHRDLKPGNVIVDEEGMPKVLDFGIARITGMDLDASTLHTSPGQLLGTLPYMSPEQLSMDPAEVDARSDVYSLGVLLYELMCGKTPFDVSSRAFAESARRIAEDEPTALTQLVPSLPEDVSTIAAKAMEKRKERRYASAAGLAADLRRFLQNEPILARPASHVYRFTRFARRNRGLVAGAVVALLALVAGSTASVAFGLREQAASERAERNFEDVRRLADERLVRGLRERADELWPVTPSRAGDLRSWVDEAQALFDRLPGHRRVLEGLRADALPYSEADRELDTVPLLERIESVKQIIGVQRTTEAAGNGSAEAMEAALRTPLQHLAELEAQVGVRKTWRFDTNEEEWTHEVLAGLVEDMEALRERVFPDVARRLEYADRRLAELVEEYRFEWDEVIEDVIDDERFGGLELEPQLGLVPVGKDSDSGLHEFVDLWTNEGPLPQRDADGSLVLTRDHGVVFVLLPGGRFTMGLSSEHPIARASEGPEHALDLDPFFMAKFELNQAQWMRALTQNPSGYQAGIYIHIEERVSFRNPVEKVTWFDANAFCQRHGWILPTEAQWEYAARAGTRTLWWTGDERESIVGAANIADQTARRNGASWRALNDWPELNDGWGAHAPNGSYQPNAFGLHEMIGNVVEWCRDLYVPYTELARVGDGLRGELGGSINRVTRGGSYASVAGDTHHARRLPQDPEILHQDLGFRPARPVMRSE